MKKAFAAVFIVLILSGCGGKKEAEVKDVLKGGFSAEFSYSYGGQDFSGSIERGIDGDFKLKMISPKALENIEFIYKDGKTEISFDNFMRYDLGEDLPQNSVVGIICKPIENAIINNLTEGDLSGVDYKIVLKDGVLEEINFNDVSVKITGFNKS